MYVYISIIYVYNIYIYEIYIYLSNTYYCTYIYIYIPYKTRNGSNGISYTISVGNHAEHENETPLLCSGFKEKILMEPKHGPY